MDARKRESTGDRFIHGPASADDGVDATLIRWMLSLTPAERLLVLQQTVRSIRRLVTSARRI
jgi:hypothetical protein